MTTCAILTHTWPPLAPLAQPEVTVAVQTVPFLDLANTVAELRPELDVAYQRVMASGWFIDGAEVQAFESEFATYCHAKHCAGVANGLDALHLILRAYGIGSDDEVIVPSHTFIATWLAVSSAGATPVPVEVDPRTFCLGQPTMRESGLQAAVSPRTKALIAVDLYGRKAPIRQLTAFCKENSIKLIVDSAQAHGARAVDGTDQGLFGDAAAYSFYPGKNLGCYGDGGAVVSDDKHLIQRVKQLRNYGAVEKYHHEVQGVNSRLDELQAAFLRVRLRHLDAWNRRRQALASQYLAALQGQSEIMSPPGDSASCDVWHLFVVRSKKRAKLQQYLTDAGIATQIHYPVPCHKSGAYADQFAGVRLPAAEMLADEVLSLPMSPHHSADQIAYVAKALCTFAQQA